MRRVKEVKKEVKKALDTIIKSLEEEGVYDPEIEFRVIDFSELCKLAKAQSSYDGWDSCCGSSSHSIVYYVLYKDGTLVEVPYGQYYQGYADHTPDSKEVSDIYVGDFLNKNTLAVIRTDICRSSYSDENWEDITVYLPRMWQTGDVLWELMQEIKKLPEEKLWELLART